jgi:catechol 2,3-dioxygenase-like lactoylglutathione lyase family enzyme
MLLEGNLLGILHLGIPVVDIDYANRWYIEKLGFKLVHEPFISTPDGTIRLSFLERDGLTLEFYQLLGADREEVRTRKDGHIDHFAMDVLDVRRGIEDLISKNAEIDPDTKDGPVVLSTVYSKGVNYVFFRGPTGERFELNERNDLNSARRTNNLGGWSHLGIPVTDINRSIQFYNQFGFRIMMEAAVPVGDGREVKITIVEKGGLYLEFYQLLDEALPEIRSRKDGHVDHVAMNVKDIDKAFSELQNAGICPLEVAPVFMPCWENGVRYFMFRGPDGEKIELNQRM